MLGGADLSDSSYADSAGDRLALSDEVQAPPRSALQVLLGACGPVLKSALMLVGAFAVLSRAPPTRRLLARYTPMIERFSPTIARVLWQTTTTVPRAAERGGAPRGGDD